MSLFTFARRRWTDLSGATLTVVTAQVFLVTDLHEDVAVRTKTKECHGEEIHHGGASGGKAEEERQSVDGNKAVQNIHSTATCDFTWRHKGRLRCEVTTWKFFSVV